MAQPPRLRSIYRSILRELPPRPILAAPRSHLRKHLRASFSDSPRDSQAVAQAEQLAAYLRSQRLYVTLIERYNPGMDMDEGERVRLSARRVGLDMPELFGENRAGN
ncbi:hypothetical protein C2857_006857 [Epichloe festucae Fl1]|uniref:Ras guanyl-nucleotide exchange factor RasGEF n=1 Tax=Epichloe festucae (strain Fl1) TaxID=877507 RepID=A0A7S9KQ91_EPIFF|nr:hypothetical protein C2857_006857 [Epichloe festucae Fl1]